MTATPVDGDNDVTLPRYFLRPCLLLLLAEGASHGYELLDQVRRLGIRAAEPGGLYRYLRTMEKASLVRSWWEPSQAGPARRTYVLTDHGKNALADAVRSLQSVRTILVELLGRYEELDDTAKVSDGTLDETATVA